MNQTLNKIGFTMKAEYAKMATDIVVYNKSDKACLMKTLNDVVAQAIENGKYETEYKIISNMKKYHSNLYESYCKLLNTEIISELQNLGFHVVIINGIDECGIKISWK